MQRPFDGITHPLIEGSVEQVLPEIGRRWSPSSQTHAFLKTLAFRIDAVSEEYLTALQVIRDHCGLSETPKTLPEALRALQMMKED